VGEYPSQLRAQQSEGYHLMGGFADDRMVVLAGFRYSLTLSRGPHLFVDDLVTAPTQQGKGYAAAMLKHLAMLARQKSLSKIWLDSRDTAKTFYEKVGFKVHTSMPCMIDVSQLE
jgi:GNAT superfamily N-acetyltransferase